MYYWLWYSLTGGLVVKVRDSDNRRLLPRGGLVDACA